MNPRLKGSKKWTAFPKEYSDQIQTIFTENFEEYLDKATLIVEGRIYPAEIMLRVGYLEEGRLTQANFEVSMDYSQSKKDAIERIHNCVDAVASMMLEYLEKTDEEQELDFPYVWKEVTFQGKKLYFQFNTINSSLEREANKLLGIDEDTLLLDEEDEANEDALEKAEVTLDPVDLDDEDFEVDSDDEDDEDSGPRMFGGKKPKKKKDDLH